MRKRDIEREESSFDHLRSTDRSGKRSSHCRATMEFGSQNPNPRNCQSLDLQCEREKMMRRIKTLEKEIGKASSRRERERDLYQIRKELRKDKDDFKTKLKSFGWILSRCYCFYLGERNFLFRYGDFSWDETRPRASLLRVATSEFAHMREQCDVS